MRRTCLTRSNATTVAPSLLTRPIWPGRRPIRYFFLTHKTDKTPIVGLLRVTSTSDNAGGLGPTVTCYRERSECKRDASFPLICPTFPAPAPVDKVDFFPRFVCWLTPDHAMIPPAPFPVRNRSDCASLSLAAPSVSDLAVSAMPARTGPCIPGRPTSHERARVDGSWAHDCRPRRVASQTSPCLCCA